MKKHPNKKIREAIQYAVDNGWAFSEAGKSSHAFGRLKCLEGHQEHQMSVWSTPKNPESHARQIVRVVGQCGKEQ